MRVVCIHCLPQCAASVVLRPFLNWAVAGFLFLSGLLTSESKILRGGVAKRLHKVLIPYLVWSGIYLVVTQRLTAGGIVKGVLFGTSSAQMYYLLVYAQLVMLTPLLYRVLRLHRLLVYCVTPVFYWCARLQQSLGLPYRRSRCSFQLGFCSTCWVLIGGRSDALRLGGALFCLGCLSPVYSFS